MHDPSIADDEIDTRPSPRSPEPDAHGQAALILAECMLHTLMEAKVLTLAQATDTVRVAVEVAADVAGEIGEASAGTRQSVGLLDAIARSLALEATDGA